MVMTPMFCVGLTEHKLFYAIENIYYQLSNDYLGPMPQHVLTSQALCFGGTQILLFLTKRFYHYIGV